MARVSTVREEGSRGSVRTPAWLRLGVAVIIASVCAAGFASLFRTALNLALSHLYGSRDLLTAFRSLPLILTIAIPAAGGALAGTCAMIATRWSGGGGVGEVMEAIVLGSARISTKATIWKALGCWVAIVSGASIGREGPL